MNIQRFTAPTSREALAKARHAFGEHTLILGNRQVVGGVEVTAMRDEPRPLLNGAEGDSGSAHTLKQGASLEESTVAQDAEELAMSTLSFQQYVRERMLRKQHERQAPRASADTPARAAPEATVSPVAEPRKTTDASGPVASEAGKSSSTRLEQGMSREVVDALNEIRGLVEQRFNTLAWQGRASKHPILAELTLKLLRTGYSPALTRKVLNDLPESCQAKQAVQHVMRELSRPLLVHHDLVSRGGLICLVGTPGAGKTTAAASLAAECIRQHGAGSVGLITLDVAKTAGYEHLRQLSRELGVTAHVAHDRQALDDMLQLLSSKHMVIVDTPGVSAGSKAMAETPWFLSHPLLERVLVLNAALDGLTLHHQVHAFKAFASKGAIAARLDEAIKLAPALDVFIQQHLPLLGCTAGQDAQEAWMDASAEQLVKRSLSTQTVEHLDIDQHDAELLVPMPVQRGVAD